VGDGEGNAGGEWEGQGEDAGREVATSVKAAAEEEGGGGGGWEEEEAGKVGVGDGSEEKEGGGGKEEEAGEQLSAPEALQGMMKLGGRAKGRVLSWDDQEEVCSSSRPFIARAKPPSS
jgi:hypothetical protein